MQKIVIFDMDGTLVDSKKDITISINYVRQKNHNLPPLSEDFVVEAINLHERNLPKLFYETESYQQTDKEVFEKHYAKQCTKYTKLYDGVYELLETLFKHGIKMGVATNAPTKFAQLMLNAVGVEHFFKEIVGADKVTVSKPDPQMLYKVLGSCEYNKDEDEAWMLGDNSKDMQSAQSAGIFAVFVTWGFSQSSDGYPYISKPQDLLQKIGVQDV